MAIMKEKERGKGGAIETYSKTRIPVPSTLKQAVTYYFFGKFLVIAVFLIFRWGRPPCLSR